MATVTVISGQERRRRWTLSDKRRIVEDSLTTTSIAEAARRHDVHPNLLHAWRREFRRELPSGGTAMAAGSEAGGAFVPVTAAAAESITAVTEGIAGGSFEVVLRNGRLLRFPEACEPSRAAALADALEGGGR
jgi:transposase